MMDRNTTNDGLQESEQRFRVVWDFASDAMVLSTPDGIVFAANPAYYSLFGFAPEEIIGHPFSRIFPPDQQQWAQEQYRVIFQQEELAPQFEQTVRREDGTQRVVESRYNFVTRDGKRTAMLSIIRDVTERKQTEEALHRSEERLRLALEAGSIGVWDWDIQQNTLTWSERVYELHGVSKESFVVTVENFLALVHPEDKTRAREVVEQALRRKVPFTIEFRLDAPQEKVHWLTTSADMIYDGAGQPIRMFGAASDISQQKELERLKDEFISMASHEFKTPITSLLGFTQLLQISLSKQGLREPVTMLEKMEKQLTRLSKLVSDLLDVSKIQVGRLDYAQEPLEIDALVHDIADMMQQIHMTHTIVIHGAAQQQVVGDSDRLGQVLINLISNAVKYSPQAKTVDLSLAASQNMVTIAVRDYGIGIPEEHQEKIFDRFYRVADVHDTTFTGLGMGLYISHEIVKRHGGKLWVESNDGKGTTFFVSLPTASP